MKRTIPTTLCLFIAVLLAPTADLYAINSNAGTSAFPFLKINPGARAVAMGGAFTGLADDEMAVYYNPAGLVQLEGKRFMVEYHSYIADINNGMIGVVLPMSLDRTIAFHINYLNYGDFIETDEAGNVLGEFSGSDMTFGVSYSMRIKPTILIGATGKFIYENLQDYSATGGAIDLGAKWVSDRNRYHAGIAIQNLGAQFSSLGEEKDNLPLTIRAGGAIRPRGLDLIASLDVALPTDNDPFVAVGLEYFKLDPVYLRLGWNSFGTNYRSEGSDDKWAGLSVGFGFDLWHTQLSYAFSPAADLGDMHRITWQGSFK
ncbi:MAG: PorV/PorQ family protein [candidate division Zixibacteria bacterium]|nr:PorV/PorQ family protein [candidate division Zixibacteria bacterium]